MRTSFVYFLVIAHGMDVVIEMLILVYIVPRPFREDDNLFIYLFQQPLLGLFRNRFCSIRFSETKKKGKAIPVPGHEGP
jgi:hypothetical protein